MKIARLFHIWKLLFFFLGLLCVICLHRRKCVFCMRVQINRFYSTCYCDTREYKLRLILFVVVAQSIRIVPFSVQKGVYLFFFLIFNHTIYRLFWRNAILFVLFSFAPQQTEEEALKKIWRVHLYGEKKRRENWSRVEKSTKKIINELVPFYVKSNRKSYKGTKLWVCIAIMSLIRFNAHIRRLLCLLYFFFFYLKNDWTISSYAWYLFLFLCCSIVFVWYFCSCFCLRFDVLDAAAAVAAEMRFAYSIFFFAFF